MYLVSIVAQERCKLAVHKGVNENEEENMVVFNSYDGFLYRSGHGREKCSKAELTQAPSPTTAASIHSGICRQAS